MIIYRPERNLCRYQRENPEAVKQEDRRNTTDAASGAGIAYLFL
jgi:hypothetical protein